MSFIFRCLHTICCIFCRENEEDKEMADFLNSKLPRNTQTGMFRSLKLQEKRYFLKMYLKEKSELSYVAGL